MKFSILIFLTYSLNCCFAQVSTVFISEGSAVVAPKTFTLRVPTNTVFELLYMSGVGRITMTNQVYLALPEGETNLYDTITVMSAPPITLTGPIVLAFTGYGNFTYRLTPQTPLASTVIVPQATSARIQIEASADLLQWTNCPPGTISNAPANLFFRIRADRFTP